MSGPFESGTYKSWREKRFTAIEKYIDTSFFSGKTLFEVGCGYADNGAYFAGLGAICTSTDARIEHLEVAKEKYPELSYFKFDCDTDKLNTKYDIILHWGTLYHLKNFEDNLKNICENTDYILLETEVCDSLEDDTKLITFTEAGPDQAFNGIGSRPSAPYVERLLRGCGFNYKVILDPILDNHGSYLYSWNSSYHHSFNNIAGWAPGFRRYWICWRSELPSPVKSELQ